MTKQTTTKAAAAFGELVQGFYAAALPTDAEGNLIETERYELDATTALKAIQEQAGGEAARKLANAWSHYRLGPSEHRANEFQAACNAVVARVSEQLASLKQPSQRR